MKKQLNFKKKHCKIKANKKEAHVKKKKERKKNNNNNFYYLYKNLNKPKIKSRRHKINNKCCKMWIHSL